MNEQEIHAVCAPCGTKYLTENQKEIHSAVTSREGICPLCGLKGNLIPIRHYNYLQPQNTKP